MSGIYIPGMELPSECLYCPCYDLGRELCNINRKRQYCHAKPSDCPLAPVPDHGRLVEADAVVEPLDEWIDAVGSATVGKGLSYYGELLGCVEDAPTIIPADFAEDTNVLTKTADKEDE